MIYYLALNTVITDENRLVITNAGLKSDEDPNEDDTIIVGESTYNVEKVVTTEGKREFVFELSLRKLKKTVTNEGSVLIPN